MSPLALHDIHLPPPHWWPPAPGWWLLAALVGIGLISASRWAYRHWQRRRQRRHLVRELQRIATLPRGSAQLTAVAVLLKRAALQRYTPAAVASLTGSAWLEFLDRTGGGGQFAHGAGRILIDGPYQPAIDDDATAVIALAQHWLEHNWS